MKKSYQNLNINQRINIKGTIVKHTQQIGQQSNIIADIQDMSFTRLEVTLN